MVQAVLDACILFGGKLTDFLLCLAENGVFEPVWSDEIHNEWMRNLAEKYQMPPNKISYRHAEMEKAFPAANCAPDEMKLTSIRALCTTDAQRKDAHVIATAATASADYIVTLNIPDFSQSILNQYKLQKLKPDAFCAQMFQQNPEQMIAGVKAHRASMIRTPYTVAEYLALLNSDKLKLPLTATLISSRKSEI